MAQQSINIGASPNTGTGDNPRAAAIKINANTTELYTSVATKADAVHTHTTAAITDFTEASQDVVGALIVAAGGTYNDTAGTISLPISSATLAGLTDVDVVAPADGQSLVFNGTDWVNTTGQSIPDYLSTHTGTATGSSLVLLAQGSNVVSITLNQLAAYVATQISSSTPVISISSITNSVTPSGTVTASGTYSNGAPTAFTYVWSGGGGSGSATTVSLTGGNYSVTAPAPSSAGSYTLMLTGTGANTASATSSTVTVATVASPTIAITSITGNTTPGGSVAVSGTYASGTPSGFTYVWSGSGGSGTATPGTLTGGNYSVTVPAPSSAGSYTLTLTGTGANTASATSTTVTVAVTPTINVATPSTQTATTMSLSGVYTGTAPTNVDYKFDSGSYVTGTGSFSASAGSWSLAGVTTPADGSHTVTVRETNAPSVISAPSGSFTVSIAASTTAFATTGTTFQGVYSLNKVKSNYAGAAVRARRVSDNVEQDIGFSGNNLDTAALATFAAGGATRVAKWYDQSGLAQHLIPASTGGQPGLTNASGAIYVMPGTTNNRPSIYIHDDVAYPPGFAIPSFVTGGTSTIAITVGLAIPNVGGEHRIVTIDNSALITNGGSVDMFSPSGQTATSASAMVNNTPYVIGMETGPTNQNRAFLNNVAGTAGGNNFPNFGSPLALRVGYLNEGSGYGFLEGYVSDITIASATTGADRALIYNDIRTYQGF